MAVAAGSTVQIAGQLAPTWDCTKQRLWVISALNHILWGDLRLQQLQNGTNLSQCV